jgi:hypothetical protein
MSAPGPQLRDIHLPPPPSWWPPAPGWWLLALLALVLLLTLVWWVRRWRRRRRIWAVVCAELEALAVVDAASCAAGVSQLMRRVARLGVRADAPVGADPWAALVRRYAPDASVTAALEPLAHAMYRPNPAIEPQTVLAAARRWLRCALTRRPRHA